MEVVEPIVNQCC